MYDPGTSQLGHIDYTPHVRDVRCVFCKEILFFHNQEGWEPEVTINASLFGGPEPTRFAHVRCLRSAIRQFDPDFTEVGDI